MKISRQPLSQIDFNTDHDNRGATPKQFKTTATLNSDYKPNYQVQFKVKHEQENNAVIMSPAPLRRNTQQLISPMHNYSQKHLQSPQVQYRGTSQQQISHTTTSQLSSEVQFLKDQNQRLQQTIFKTEAEIQRGTSTHFIKELENKISMLQKLNDKLNQDNQQLIRLSDINLLNKEKSEQQKQINKLEEQYDQLLSKFEEYDYDKFLEESQQTNKINSLVTDLENKITGLIVENEKLNSYAQETQNLDQQIEQLQLDVQSHQITYQKSKHDEVQYRYKYDQAVHEERMSKKKPQQNPLYTNQIQILEEENEKLRQLIKNIDYDEEIKDLEDRIQVIAQDNWKLEQQLLQ